MRIRVVCAVSLVLAIALTGCLPKKRVVWSPDGRWAAVLGGDGLRLCDPTGKLSDPVQIPAVDVAWMPDSRGLVLQCVGEVVRSWSEVQAYLAPGRSEVVSDAAERALAHALIEYDRWNEEDPWPMLALGNYAFAGLTRGEVEAAKLYFKDRLSDRVPDRLKRLMHFDEIGGHGIAQIQLAEASESGILPGKVVCRLLDAGALRLSPDGKTAAYTIEVHPSSFGGVSGSGPTGFGAIQRLCVLPLDGSPPRTVADLVAAFPDWSADGRYLVFARSEVRPEQNHLTLGTISRCEVRDAHGTLLDKFGALQDLAGVIFRTDLEVRCLPDGRAIFPSPELHLPATKDDMPQRALMFAVNPDRSPVVTRLIPRKSEADVPDMTYEFEVSPDGRLVSLFGARNEVSVLDLSTGITRRVVPQFDLHKDLVTTLPAWRSPDELCCLGPGPIEGRAVLNLIKLNPSTLEATDTIALSADWPESVARDFLFKEQNGESQPAASAPARSPS